MRVFNFSAGPAVMPEDVLRTAAAEMLDWHGSGMSVMEKSHRGKEFISIYDKAQADLRGLLKIPANYKILFLQGGAIAENAIVPMNLLLGRSVADYVNTGEWSKKSIKEAKKYCTVNIVASGEDKSFTYVPAQETWKLTHDAAYVHVCTNETIGGVDLLDRALPITPSVFHWKEQAAAESILNTPATYAVYIAGLVFEWLQA